MSQVSIAGHSRSTAPAFMVLGSLSFCHFLNDMMQSLLPSIYPLLKVNFDLDFGQIGLITLTYQITASLLQPLVGTVTDRHPQPFSLAAGMIFTLVGLIMVAFAGSFAILLLGSALVGTGSSIFHPESSRIARLASGGRHGFAQSLFQVGGNFGQSTGPLLAAFIILPRGQGSVAWFAVAALVGFAMLAQVGFWYKRQDADGPRHSIHEADEVVPAASARRVRGAIAILLVLIFSKYFYLASITSYLIFYLIHRFGVSVEAGQIHLFIFMGSVALGTIAGGPLGDRFGRKYVIWLSILGVLPFTLALPYVGLTWTAVLSVPIGVILSSAFPAIIVYAQELVPGKTGMVSGMFFGFAFGMGGIGAAVLGQLADATSIIFVYHVCAFLPALGLLAAFLPNIDSHRLMPSPPAVADASPAE